MKDGCEGSCHYKKDMRLVKESHPTYLLCVKEKGEGEKRGPPPTRPRGGCTKKMYERTDEWLPAK